MWTLGGPSLEFLQELEKTGSKPLIVCNSSNATPEFLNGSKKLGFKLLMVTGFPALDDPTRPLLAQFKSDLGISGANLESASLEGYLDAAILVEAMNRSGKDLTRENLRKTIETKMTDVDLGGFKIQYRPDRHQALSEIFLYEVKDGVLTSVHK
jgi:hypothetical protein